MKLLVSMIGCLLLTTGVSRMAGAEENLTAGDPAAGRAFALQVCTPCHVVAQDQLSPRRFSVAPSFADIANTRAMTSSALHAFLATPHPTMPNLILGPVETEDVVAYILRLRKRS